MATSADSEQNFKEISRLKSMAKIEKEKGNEAYKKKRFQKAINHYDKAIKYDPTNMTYLNNKAAVYLEQDKIDECLTLCDDAIKLGRANNADRSLIARAYERMGNAHKKIGNFENALKSYELSLSELKSQEVQVKKKEIEIKLGIATDLNNNQKMNDDIDTRSKSKQNLKKKDVLLSEKQMQQIKRRNQATSQELFNFNKMNEILFKSMPDINYLDNRVQTFELDTLPAECDKLKCQDRLNEMYETARSIKFHYECLKMKTNWSNKIDFLKRLGNSSPETLEWYANASIGDLNKNFINTPYDARVMHSYTNVALKGELLTPGKTHVSIGFTDLSMFHTVKFLELWTLEKPLKWIGYEASVYCVAKTAVIIAMAETGSSTDEILQVWYSATWTKATLNSFRSAINYLLNNKTRFTALAELEVNSLLEHWLSCEVTLKQARQKWLDNSTINLCTPIANFKQSEDRKALCAYAITGELLKGEVGSVVMWSFPNNFIGSLAYDENIFQTIDSIELFKIRNSSSCNIVEAAIKYFRNSIEKLIKYIREKSLIIDLNFKMVTLGDKNLIMRISALNPWTISWSNVSDYMRPQDFHLLAHLCSGENTLHFAYTMNWCRLVYGASILDYEFDTKEGGEYLDFLLDSANTIAKEFQDVFKLKSLLHYPPINDARNLAESMLYINLKKNWIEHFFSKRLSTIQCIETQVQSYKTPIYDMFSRTSSTIFFVFSYDPEMQLNSTKDEDF